MFCYIIYIDNGQLQDMWNILKTKGLNAKMYNHVTESLEALIYVGSCEVPGDSGAGWLTYESVMNKFIVDTTTRGGRFEAITPRRRQSNKTYANMSTFGGTTPNSQEDDEVSGCKKWRNRSMQDQLPYANIQDLNTDEFARLSW